MPHDSPTVTDAEHTGSDAGSARATSVRLAVELALSAILGIAGNLADISALIDKFKVDRYAALVQITVVFVVLTLIAAVIGVVRHYGILTVARLRRAMAIVLSACAGFLIGHFLAGTDPGNPAPSSSGSPAGSVSAQPPPSSASNPPTTPTPDPEHPTTPPPTHAPSTAVPPVRTPKTVPPPPPTITTSGAITAPAAGSGVQRCALVTGTARLAAGKTLVLAVRNLDNDEPDKWYVQYPHGWDNPATLSNWRGVEYFPGDLAQHYEIGLFAVDLNAAGSAHAAGERASNDLVQGAIPLDTQKVVQREGGTGSDCD